MRRLLFRTHLAMGTVAALAILIMSVTGVLLAFERLRTGSAFAPHTFAEDAVTYVFGPAYRIPFLATASQPDGADIARNAIEFTHVDAWRYGHNLVEVQIKKSNGVEPAALGLGSWELDLGPWALGVVSWELGVESWAWAFGRGPSGVAPAGLRARGRDVVLSGRR